MDGRWKRISCCFLSKRIVCIPSLSFHSDSVLVYKNFSFHQCMQSRKDKFYKVCFVIFLSRFVFALFSYCFVLVSASVFIFRSAIRVVFVEYPACDFLVFGINEKEKLRSFCKSLRDNDVHWALNRSRSLFVEEVQQIYNLILTTMIIYFSTIFLSFQSQH